jgi:hypothetical protein
VCVCVCRVLVLVLLISVYEIGMGILLFESSQTCKFCMFCGDSCVLFGVVKECGFLLGETLEKRTKDAQNFQSAVTFINF